MEEVFEYLKLKGYKLLDITKSVNSTGTSYEKYIKCLKNKSDVVIYFLKTSDNKCLFSYEKTLSFDRDYDCTLLYNDKSIILKMDKFTSFDSRLKRIIGKLLNLDMSCYVCHKLDDNIQTCVKCTCIMCDYCVKKNISEFNKEVNCPKCNHGFGVAISQTNLASI